MSMRKRREHDFASCSRRFTVIAGVLPCLYAGASMTTGHCHRIKSMGAHGQSPMRARGVLVTLPSPNRHHCSMAFFLPLNRRSRPSHVGRTVSRFVILGDEFEFGEGERFGEHDGHLPLGEDFGRVFDGPRHSVPFGA